MRAKAILEKIIEENRDKPDFYIRNLLKEYLQILILHYIYSSEKYKELFFYGGTCLAHCYDLPRLSEDLDFVDVKKEVDINHLAKDVRLFLEKEAGLFPSTKVQKFRIYFKFPLLKELGLAKDKAESDYLFVKVEIFSEFDFCDEFEKEFKPIFKFNHSIIVKTFDLPTLMSTKIRAVLYRKWEKTSKKGEALTKVKGRDFFDLMWFLQKKVEPNFRCIGKIDNKEDLKTELLKRIERLDGSSVSLDLKNFVANSHFADDLGSNIKEILKKEIERW